MVVYRLTCRVTGKSYIGATARPLAQRLSGHRSRSRESGLKGMYLIAQAIREHGWGSFDVMVLAKANSSSELAEKERSLIQLCDTLHPRGYNQLAGGGPYEQPGLRGRPTWNKGVPHTAAAKARMSVARQGSKNYRARAIEYNGATYQTMLAACVANGLSVGQMYGRLRHGSAKYLTPGIPGRYGAPHYAHTADTKARMSTQRSGSKHYRARAIEIDGKVYSSIKDAEDISGYSRQQLKTRLKDGRAKYLSESKYIQ